MPISQPGDWPGYGAPAELLAHAPDAALVRDPDGDYPRRDCHDQTAISPA